MDDMTNDADRTIYLETHQKASITLVAVLSDQALCVVRTVFSSPKAMTEKLDERYESKSTASKICKMSESVSIRYNNLRDDLRHHIDRIASLLDRLKCMENELKNSLAIGILVVSIEVPQL